MTCPLTVNIILPNKRYPFSIVWVDNTDSICDLQCLLTYMDNHTTKRHKADTTRSSTTNRSARRTSNGVGTPSSLPSPPSLPRSPFPPRDAPPDTPAHTGGIFTVIPSHPGDLVDNLTRSGSFTFLDELFDTECLIEFRDFRISRVMPKGETVQEIAASMNLVLDLADKYPRDSLVTHILDCVVQFLPAFLCPCTHSGRVRQIISSDKRFQRGDWKTLWETALCLPRKETDNNSKRSHNRDKIDTSTIHARVVYAEHCA